MNYPAPEPRVVHLPTLFRQIKEGKIRIPAFQRDLVWKKKQILDLLKSIYKGYPIGGILFWKTKEKLVSSTKMPFPDMAPGSSHEELQYVLDGMQRLSCLYGIFYYNKEKHSDIFEVYFDLKNENFIHSSPKNLDTYLVPLNIIFHPSLLLNKQLEISKMEKIDTREKDKYVLFLTKLQSIFQEYMIPVVTIEGRELGEVIEIFERINSTGTRLSTVDFVRAMTWTNDLDLRKEIDTIKQDLDFNRDKIDDETIIKIMNIIGEDGFYMNTTNIQKIRDIPHDTWRSKINKTNDIIKKLILILKDITGAQDMSLIPYEAQLIIMSNFLDKKDDLSDEDLHFIKSWYWSTTLNEQYGGKPDSYIIRDNKEIEEGIRKDDFFGICKKINIEAKDFTERPLSSMSALTKAYFSLHLLNTTEEIMKHDCYSNIHSIKLEFSNFIQIIEKEEIESLEKKYHSKSIANMLFYPVYNNKKTSIIDLLKDKDESFMVYNFIDSDMIKLLKNKDIESKEVLLNKRAELILQSFLKNVNSKYISNY